MNAVPDARLILRDEELDLGLELILLAETALWVAVDAVLEGEPSGLGRSHWRAAFFLRRRPGAGVQDVAQLTGLSKQAASRTLTELAKAGLCEKQGGDLDGRRRPMALTDAGRAFEARVSERLRAMVGRAYRTGGLDGVAGGRRILAALAGPRVSVGADRARDFA
ncbi:MAG: MarR family transcriptional regulator [Caulobacter sp.]|nr:MarR family transcriptional regulator [Caulobacter sp.]